MVFPRRIIPNIFQLFSLETKVASWFSKIFSKVGRWWKMHCPFGMAYFLRCYRMLVLGRVYVVNYQCRRWLVSVCVRTSSSPLEPWRNGSFGFAFRDPIGFFPAVLAASLGVIEIIQDWSKRIQNESKGYYLEIKQQQGHITCVSMYIQCLTHVYDHVFKQHVEEQLIHVPVLTFKPNRWYRNCDPLIPTLSYWDTCGVNTEAISNVRVAA